MNIHENARSTPASRELLVCRVRKLGWSAADLIAYLRSFRQPARLIGQQLGIARSTVSAVLARRGLGPQRALEPPQPVCRYERRRPGDLLHLDTKKLGRFWHPGHRVNGRGVHRSEGADWDFVHVAIDDHSRIAYVEVLADESPLACVAFLRRASDTNPHSADGRSGVNNRPRNHI